MASRHFTLEEVAALIQAEDDSDVDDPNEVLLEGSDEEFDELDEFEEGNTSYFYCINHTSYFFHTDDGASVAGPSTSSSVPLSPPFPLAGASVAGPSTSSSVPLSPPFPASSPTNNLQYDYGILTHTKY